MGATWDDGGIERLERVLAGHVERGGVPGLAWLVARHGDVRSGVAGMLTADDPGAVPVPRDGIFRISSVSKPVTAVAALVLVEECRLRLDDPIDDLLPELADRRVMARPDGPLDETVPAARPITVRDVLTFRMGLGMDFSAPFPQPTLAAMSALGLGDGPPAPAGPPEPDEWIRRLGTLPLAHQPGSRWLYDTSAEVLGVLVARAAGQPFDRFLAERVLGPLGMVDTGFSVPPPDLPRFAGCYGAVGDDGRHAVYDAPDGQWSRPPAFPGGASGLVSTVDDLLAFGSMLLAGGTHLGERNLSRPTVAAMTTNQLTPEQLATAAPSPDGAQGWGLGVGVHVRRVGPAHAVGAYGWDGGLGSSWANDPSEDLVGILLTNQMWTSPAPPAVCRDFWTCIYAALAD
jgi:CubicO group peptidase (beta-lactamase class C family)